MLASYRSGLSLVSISRELEPDPAPDERRDRPARQDAGAVATENHDLVAYGFGNRSVRDQRRESREGFFEAIR